MDTLLTTAPLGEILLRDEAITPDQLEQALLRQQMEKLPLGRVLTIDGVTSNYVLHRALAKQQSVAFANLLTDPPQAELLHAEDIDSYLDLKALPWREDVHGITFATTEISMKLRIWCEWRYKKPARFVITSPLDITRAIQHRFAGMLDESSRLSLFRKNPTHSARVMMAAPQRRTGLLLLALFTALCAISLPMMVAFLLIASQLFYLFTLAFKLVLFRKGSLTRLKATPPAPPDAELPVYSILVPMYKEAESLPRLLASLDRLDYPKSKLDVKLVLEEDDSETYEAAKRLKPQAHIDIIRVPYSLPRTKPKACNYALRFARGDFVTIYDAEDQPEPQQLKKAVAMFRRHSNRVVCLQARLNYYNKSENLLTRLFAIEYAAWFDYMLRGLQAFRIPIPLGGTSNHIALARLRELGEWDPYNVTEDADLGIRLALAGYQTRLLNSITLEEAPVTLGAWLKQRSRWIKGYIQTWLVHMRDPLSLYHSLGGMGFAGFQLFVGGPCLVFVLAPFLWLFSLLWAAGAVNPPAHPLPPGFLELAVLNLAAGIALHFLMAWVVVIQKQWRSMWFAIVTFPFYWVLHSVASFRSVWQLIFRPHHWEKTDHAVSRLRVSENSVVFQDFG